MTKVEQLKARAYGIKLMEREITNQEKIIKYYKREKPEELEEYEIEEIAEADNKIRMLEYIMEELAK